MAVSEAETAAFGEILPTLEIMNAFDAAREDFAATCKMYASHPSAELNPYLAIKTVSMAESFGSVVRIIGGLDSDVDASQAAIHHLLADDDNQRTRLLRALTEPDAFTTWDEASRSDPAIPTLRDKIDATMKDSGSWADAAQGLQNFYLDTLKREVNTFATLALTRKAYERSVRLDYVRAVGKHTLAVLGVIGGSAALGLTLTRRQR